jgi:glycosyltransferase involved in cell wall biosynthesis
MNIAFFIGDISRTGGTERVTSVVASELAKRGHNVFILSLAHGKQPFFCTDTRVHILSLGMQNHSANLSDFLIVKKLRSFLKKNLIEFIVDVDIILTYYSTLGRFNLSTRVISWEHFNYKINVGDLFQRIRRRIARSISINFATALITLTQRDRQQYINSGSCRIPIEVIANPKTIEHSNRSTLESKVVLSVGRLVSQKGFDLLLAAWANICFVHPDWLLRIVGSGPDHALLVSMSKKLGIADRVQFVSQTADIEKHYLDSSIFVLSSRFEGFVLVLIEAKSFGLPSVSFDCDCGPSDIIISGVDGLLAQPEDTNDLSQKISYLIGNNSERRTMGRQAAMDQRFNLKEIIDTWESMFQRYIRDSVTRGSF